MLSLSEVFERNAYRREIFECQSPHQAEIADALVYGVNNQFPVERLQAFRWSEFDAPGRICVVLPEWQLRRLNWSELRVNMRRSLGLPT